MSTREKNIMKDQKESKNNSSSTSPRLGELVDISVLQEMQDWFSETTGISVTIRGPDGHFVTRPSHTNRFCRYVLTSEEGCGRCRMSNRLAYEKASRQFTTDGVGEPVKYVCHTGLTQFAAPIVVDGHCVATLVIGDRPAGELSVETIAKLAAELGLAEDKLREYAEELKPWSEKEMRRSIKFLHYLAGAIAEMSFQGYQLRRRLQELTSLYETSRLLTSTLNLEEVLNIISERLTKAVGLHACSIRLLERGRLVIRSYYNLSKRYVEKGPVVISRSEIDQQVMKGQVVQIPDMTNDPRVLYPAEAREEGLGSGLAVPLISKNKVIGALHLYSSQLHDFTDDEVRVIRAITNHAATAIENARLYEESLEKQMLDRELVVAREIQERLLPRSSPDIPGLEISYDSRACRQVGGDFYDFIPLDDEHLGIVIADVAGKGIPGALLMATARIALRAQVESPIGGGPAEIIERVNRTLCRDTHSSQFVSLFYGALHLDTMELIYSNGGHNNPFRLYNGKNGESELEWLEAGGLVLGAVPDEKYEEGRARLEKGDTLVLYTDGITEARNIDDELYGEERLINIVKTNRRRSATFIVQSIRDDMRAFCGVAPDADDRTLVVVRVK